MNIYKTKFHANCPADGQSIEYSLLVRAKAMILVETILKEIDCIQSGYHEDIADRLFASLGAEIILSASHQGVSIVAVRKMTGQILVERATIEQALDALLHRTGGSDQVQRIDAAITDLCAALAQQPEPAQKPVTDPFADIRDKRMGELNMEQRDRATELWLREQIGPREDYWYPHLQTLFRIIDRLREQPEPAQEPVAWMNPDDGDVVSKARREAWERDYGLGGKGNAARFTVALGPIIERKVRGEAE